MRGGRAGVTVWEKCYSTESSETSVTNRLIQKDLYVYQPSTSQVLQKHVAQRRILCRRYATRTETSTDLHSTDFCGQYLDKLSNVVESKCSSTVCNVVRTKICWKLKQKFETQFKKVLENFQKQPQATCKWHRTTGALQNSLHLLPYLTSKFSNTVKYPKWDRPMHVGVWNWTGCSFQTLTKVVLACSTGSCYPIL